MVITKQLDATEYLLDCNASIRLPGVNEPEYELNRNRGYIPYLCGGFLYFSRRQVHFDIDFGNTQDYFQAFPNCYRSQVRTYQGLTNLRQRLANLSAKHTHTHTERKREKFIYLGSGTYNGIFNQEVSGFPGLRSFLRSTRTLGVVLLIRKVKQRQTLGY